MCTAVALGGFFGRNLDLERSFGQRLTVTPRAFPIPLRALPPLEHHYAMVGTALVQEGFPLYFDAVNEHGLAMAGLDFPGFAVYRPCLPTADNVTPFELIPWVLGTCKTLAEARQTLERVNLLDQAFSPQLPLTPMHWLLADATGCAAVEPLEEGLQVRDDPAGVLTNSPPLDWHLTNLSRFSHLSPHPPKNPFHTPPLGRGLGAVGLPGDSSSPARFVRTAFHRAYTPEGEVSLTGCLHLLSAAAVPRGSVRTAEGELHATVYTACCDLRRGYYCLSPYEDRRLRGVCLGRENLEASTLTTYDTAEEQDIRWLN